MSGRDKVINNPLEVTDKASTERGDGAMQKEKLRGREAPREFRLQGNFVGENSSNSGVLQALINGCSESPANNLLIKKAKYAGEKPKDGIVRNVLGEAPHRSGAGVAPGINELH